MKMLFAALLVFGSLLSVSPAQADTWEFGWDRPGYDYKNFDLAAPRAVVCQWQCQKDSRCRAWTYVKPGIQGPNPRCWLKHRVPNPVRSNCCTSGVIQ